MSKIESITSAANPLIKDVRRAILRGGLTDDGWCVAESFHLLEEAIRSGRKVPVVLVSESARVASNGLRTDNPARQAVPVDCRDGNHSGRHRAGRAAQVVDRSAFRRPKPGCRARRTTGPGQRRRNRPHRRSLRGHRRDVPQGHRQPAPSENAPRIGGLAVSDSVGDRCDRGGPRSARVIVVCRHAVHGLPASGRRTSISGALAPS